jgi:hypothetical protein
MDVGVGVGVGVGVNMGVSMGVDVGVDVSTGLDAVLSKRMSARNRCFELKLGFLIKLRITCLKLAVLKLQSCSNIGIHPSFGDSRASVKYANVPTGISRGSSAIWELWYYKKKMTMVGSKLACRVNLLIAKLQILIQCLLYAKVHRYTYPPLYIDAKPS